MRLSLVDKAGEECDVKEVENCMKLVQSEAVKSLKKVKMRKMKRVRGCMWIGGRLFIAPKFFRQRTLSL